MLKRNPNSKPERKERKGKERKEGKERAMAKVLFVYYSVSHQTERAVDAMAEVLMRGCRRPAR